jgi:hypothetical protein
VNAGAECWEDQAGSSPTCSQQNHSAASVRIAYATVRCRQEETVARQVARTETCEAGLRLTQAVGTSQGVDSLGPTVCVSGAQCNESSRVDRPGSGKPSVARVGPAQPKPSTPKRLSESKPGAVGPESAQAVTRYGVVTSATASQAALDWRICRTANRIG